MAELRTETMTVNMGPQHPSTHGVLRLVLELDGEVIQSVIPTIGYLHTGIEKTAEQKKWQQVIPLVERMDYLGAQSNSLAYALAVEKLLGLQMPARVNDIRVLIAELQRIASHLIWLGTHAMEIGAVSMLFYAIRERELLLNINELIAGFRFFPSYIRIGGLREDLPRGFLLRRLAVEFGLTEAGDRVAGVALVVDRQMTLAVLVDIGELGVAKLVPILRVEGGHRDTSFR